MISREGTEIFVSHLYQRLEINDLKIRNKLVVLETDDYQFTFSPNICLFSIDLYLKKILQKQFMTEIFGNTLVKPSSNIRTTTGRQFMYSLQKAKIVWSNHLMIDWTDSKFVAEEPIMNFINQTEILCESLSFL